MEICCCMDIRLLPVWSVRAFEQLWWIMDDEPSLLSSDWQHLFGSMAILWRLLLEHLVQYGYVTKWMHPLAHSFQVGCNRPIISTPWWPLDQGIAEMMHLYIVRGKWLLFVGILADYNEHLAHANILAGRRVVEIFTISDMRVSGPRTVRARYTAILFKY